MWTPWREWTQCSLTCGLGSKRRERTCQDRRTHAPMRPGLDCLGTGASVTDDCKLKDCPVDGGWTEWQNWSGCSVLCGPYGNRRRVRHCANPLPQFDGKKCEGEDMEKSKCVGIPKCPGEYS